MWKRRRMVQSSADGNVYFACFDHQQSLHDDFSERRHSRKGRSGTRFTRYRFVLPRVRIRLFSPLNLFDKVRESYVRLAFGHKKPDMAAITPLNQGLPGNVSFCSDAIADCIEFIKRTAATDARIL